MAKAKLTVASLSRELRENQQTVDLLQEQLLDLEVAMREYGWERFGAQMEREFSRWGLRQICAASRYMFLKNPLVNRAVSLQSIYVWGQSVTISSEDESTQRDIEVFTQDYKNQVEMFSHQARTMKEVELQVLGNLFFVFFTAPGGYTIIRTIPVDEIEEIHCNPQDSKEPWLYRRISTVKGINMITGAPQQQQVDCFYPDFRYEPTDRPEKIGGIPVMWDSPVFHVRVGGLSDMKFGVPETYQAIDWTRAYTRHMENWSQVTEAYATFAFQYSTKGGKAGIAKAKTKLNSTLGDAGNMLETNPPPVRGSVFIAGEGNELAAVKTAGATTSADEGRRLLLMVCAAFGMPESFFGDVSVGTLATAKSLDRPTELKFRDRQEMWKWIITTILEWALDKRSAKSNATRGLRPVAGRITVTMPPILEHDVTEQVNAIVTGATLAGHPDANVMPRETITRMVLNALGEQNVDQIIADMQAIWDEKDAQAAVQADSVNKAVAAVGTKQAPAVQENLRKLVEAIDKLTGKVAA